jgi:hypothetical protein
MTTRKTGPLLIIQYSLGVTKEYRIEVVSALLILRVVSLCRQ